MDNTKTSEDLSITFIAKYGKAVCTENGVAACEITYDGTLTVKLWYDFSEEPLVLTASACEGEQVLINVRSYRIELFAGERLSDEEWPCGKRYISSYSHFDGDIAVEIKALAPEDLSEKPYYTRRSIKTDEIRIPGVNIGDCIPYSDCDGGDGKYHLIYLYDRHHHRSKWHFGAHQWAHVSTEDFKTWDEHPMAVEITEGFEGSICTGSICKAEDENGVPAWYAWYAVRMCDRSPARMTYAKSYDLVHFEKCRECFHLPDGYEPTSARDPMVFFLDSRYHMFVTTTRLSDQSGCLAHLVNERMAIDGWKDAGATVAWAELVGKDDPSRYWQPECPDHFRMGKYYYIVFGIGGRGRYGFSKQPYGGWYFPENNIIPCGNVPKSALLPHTGRRIFAGFIEEGGYGGRIRAVEAKQNADGSLTFEDIEL